MMKINGKFLLLVIFSTFFCVNSQSSIIMSTTTSTENSGLLKVLLPAFKQETGIEIKVIAVGSGKALKLAESGDVDVVLSHAPEAELDLVKRGFVIDRKQFMYNDFILIGPKSDPAGIKGDKQAIKAFQKISEKQVPFISRGDQSGTDLKEKAIWKITGISNFGPWYIQAGQGMEAVLIMSNEKDAYTLTDRGTYLSIKNKTNEVVLCEGDTLLYNPYAIMAVNPEKHPTVKYAEAKKFCDWIISEKSKKIIENLKIDNQQLFFFLESK